MPEIDLDTDAVSELVIVFKATLEPYFMLGQDELLRVRTVIQIYGIRNKQQLLENAGRLAPIIVKDSNEQAIFRQIIERTIAESAIQTIPSGIDLGVSDQKKNPETNRWWVMVLTLLLIAGAIAIYLYEKSKHAGSERSNRTLPIQQAPGNTPKIPQVQAQTVEEGVPNTNVLGPRPLAEYFIALLASIILAMVGVALAHNFRRKRIKALDDRYHPPKKLGWPHVLLWPDLSAKIFFNEVLGILIPAFSLKKTTSGRKLNIPGTIYKTIRNAGFIHFAYSPYILRNDCVFLIDVGNGNNLQSECIDTFPGYFRKKGISCQVYYYRNSPAAVSVQKKMTGSISFEEFSDRHCASFLILIGDGHGFIPAYKPKEKETESSLLRTLAKWPNKILFSVIPRANWSSVERELFQILPIYPATESGFEYFLQSLQTTATPKLIYPRDEQETYQAYPIENSVQACRNFLKNEKLVNWLCCLALADQVNLSTIIAIGKELEAQCYPGVKLVTIFNLLQITSAKWLQTGVLTNAYRKELIQNLKVSERGQDCTKAASKALQRLLLFVPTEKGTLLDLEKGIQMAVYKQWGDDKGSLEIAYLHRHNLLDSFSGNYFKDDGKMRHLSFLKENTIKIALATIMTSVILFLGIIAFRPARDWVKRVASPLPVKDSFAYFNNQAAILMNRYHDSLPESYVKKAGGFLRKAAAINKTEPHLLFNLKALVYIPAKYWYGNSNYKAARDSFAKIAGVNDSIGIYAYYSKLAALLHLEKRDMVCTAYSSFVREVDLKSFHVQQALAPITCQVGQPPTLNPALIKKPDPETLNYVGIKPVKPNPASSGISAMGATDTAAYRQVDDAGQSINTSAKTTSSDNLLAENIDKLIYNVDFGSSISDVLAFELGEYQRNAFKYEKLPLSTECQPNVVHYYYRKLSESKIAGRLSSYLENAGLSSAFSDSDGIIYSFLDNKLAYIQINLTSQSNGFYTALIEHLGGEVNKNLLRYHAKIGKYYYVTQFDKNNNWVSIIIMNEVGNSFCNVNWWQK
jgi:hypothetical protein